MVNNGIETLLSLGSKRECQNHDYRGPSGVDGVAYGTGREFPIPDSHSFIVYDLFTITPNITNNITVRLWRKHNEKKQWL